MNTLKISDLVMGPIFEEWGKLIEAPWPDWKSGSNEPPWSFGELAATSILAGAVWRTPGMWCVQERLSKKWKSSAITTENPNGGVDGAADLRVWNSHDQYSFEMKWDRVSIDNRKRPYQRMQTLVDAAVANAGESVKPHGGRAQHKFGIAFGSVEADSRELWMSFVKKKPESFRF